MPRQRRAQSWTRAESFRSSAPDKDAPWKRTTRGGEGPAEQRRAGNQARRAPGRERGGTDGPRSPKPPAGRRPRHDTRGRRQPGTEHHRSQRGTGPRAGSKPRAARAQRARSASPGPPAARRNATGPPGFKTGTAAHKGRRPRRAQRAPQRLGRPEDYHPKPGVARRAAAPPRSPRRATEHTPPTTRAGQAQRKGTRGRCRARPGSARARRSLGGRRVWYSSEYRTTERKGGLRLCASALSALLWVCTLGFAD